MSRTDKDRPYWSDAEYMEPFHFRCGNAYRTYFGLVYTIKSRECDLPPEPPPLRVYHRNRFLNKECAWEPAWPAGRDVHGRDRHKRNVPGWYVDHIWNNPTRVLARDECLQAMKEYRANGEVDIIPHTDRARNCAKWAWY